MIPSTPRMRSSGVLRAEPGLNGCRNRLVVLVSACLIVVASACGGRSQMTSTAPPASPPSAPATPGPGGSESGSGSNPGGGSGGTGSGTAQGSCAAVPVAMARGPQRGVAPFPDPAPANPSNPGPGPSGSVCISTPANGETVVSPLHLVAPASLNNGIKYMRVFV